MYEMLVGLQVTDDALYQTYREAMAPILRDHGGGFHCDFRVSEVLLSPAENAINRVFTIYFPDRETSERFFANPAYLEVRKAKFELAVASVTILAEYHRADL